jgi:hypothetical protein
VNHTVTITDPLTSAPMPARITGTYALGPCPSGSYPLIVVSIHRQFDADTAETLIATLGVANDWYLNVPAHLPSGTYFVVAILALGAEVASDASLYVYKP